MKAARDYDYMRSLETQRRSGMAPAVRERHNNHMGDADMRKPEVGEIVTCAETGKPFVVAPDGFTFNYATNEGGEILSDEGVDIREKRALLERTKPFYCYLSSDKSCVGGWKGNVLGTVQRYKERSGFGRGSSIARFIVKDVHDGWWSGRAAGADMMCTLRAMKHAPRL